MTSSLLGAAIIVLGLAASVPAWAGPLTDQGQAVADDTTTNLSGLEALVTVQPSDWIYKPKPFSMLAFLPKKVIKPGIQGKVMLRCKILPSADVRECTVVSETDPDGILGDAALKSSASFKIRPRTINGKLADNAWVLIPVVFNLGPLRD